MIRFADSIKKYTGPNPFSDSQARNYSDEKISNEFYPISTFWTLFNDQHEVLLGTRGCGKTFLLKMMRYSMLKRMTDIRAKDLVEKKEYLGLYVPMYLEVAALFNNLEMTSEMQILLFQVTFNCKLAQSLISELQVWLSEEDNDLTRIKLTSRIVRCMNKAWFEDDGDDIYTLYDIKNKIDGIFHNIDFQSPDVKTIPPVFKRQICSSLSVVKDQLSQIFDWQSEPTWIVCVDEAEFLNETLQKCINSFFRSDTNRIALKVATLPYYHTTLKTLIDTVSIVANNDFSYRVVDIDYNSVDYINLTNSLCKHRLKRRFNNEKECQSLEEFVGKENEDKLIDYFRKEVGKDNASREIIEAGIISAFSAQRRENAPQYTNKRKTIYDKFAPIYFVREMYKLNKFGNRIAGWYAGAPTIRKVSQGNPRLFIQIMNRLFETARVYQLTPKQQSKTIIEFSLNFCGLTAALEDQGPIINEMICGVASLIKQKTHNKNALIPIGNAFIIKYDTEDDFRNNKKWIECAIAHSRLVVSDIEKKEGITRETKYTLANPYAVYYWLPIRNDSPTNISLIRKDDGSYAIKEEPEQLTLFDFWEMEDEN